MNGKNHILSIILFLFSFLGIAQEAILCSSQHLYLKIENSTDVPTISSNSDGSINLSFAQQYITDIFADYVIYDFHQAYPSGSDELQKHYDITFNSKGLIEAIITQIPTSTMIVSVDNFDLTNLPFRTTISPNLIQVLDGKTYDVTKFISTSDADGCYGNCPLYDVPSDFIFRVSFNFNTETELLIMESESLTSCGNAFSIALTGGNPNGFGTVDNTLQFWEVNSETATTTEFSQPCHNIEATIFAVLDIACPAYNYANGNISVTVDPETEIVQFYRTNVVFGYHIIEFSEANLSIEEERFQFMKPFKIKGSPYLQITNLNNQPISVEIYTTSGQQIIPPTIFEENGLNISNLSFGLYFIRLSNLNNQQKIFKFLKN